ncbi:response regulator protein-CheY-like nd an HD-GYP domain [Lachnospiraceae bacterium KM106-2]|nr:response regulator protein-CheY-like nd an HD-GYP domain [Lachnospiraceae bacterium KM106-2]
MHNKKILVSLAKPGMKVAENVYTPSNILISPKGTTLTDYIIDRFRSYSIESISIEIPHKNPSSKPETQHFNDKSRDSSTYSNRIRSSKEFKQFHKEYDESIDDFKNQMNSIIQKNDKINSEHLLEETSKLINTSRNGFHLFHMIHNLRNYDDMTYAHSINVSLICNIIGRWIGYSNEDIDLLTLAGLLHDIGKLMMPQSIISKPEPLTPEEYNLIKTHPVQGYNLIRNCALDNRIKRAILEHHERCDGSGYPYGKKSAKIHDFSKIVAIADVYDAMTATRVYRKGLCPFDVIEHFEHDGMLRYDVKFLTPFLHGVVQTYMNNSVMLNNGHIGKIIMLNTNSLSKPIVQVDNQFIDTSKDRSVRIQNII